MMLALGVGGWVAGLMHLITHAFFKSLLFMCSGSVIHAVHTNEMPEMGGLRKKMPYTATTMLIGCLAIAGAGIPFMVGLSGYYSKDAILEQAFLLGVENNTAVWLLFWIAAGGAAITAFYMFRLWYLTFAGKPRDQHRYDHAHESPKVMYVPLIILSVFAVVVAWDYKDAAWGALAIVIGGLLLLVIHSVLNFFKYDSSFMPTRRVYIGMAVIAGVLMVSAGGWYSLFHDPGIPDQKVALDTLIGQSHAAGIKTGAFDGKLVGVHWPNEYASHAPAIKIPVTLIAFSTAVFGILIATVFYCWNKLSPEDVRRQFSSVYTFLINKWYFDELYDLLFVRPTFVIAAVAVWIDREIFDRLIDGSAWCVKKFSAWWTWISDTLVVDASVDGFAALCYRSGLSLRRLQTGSVRQYVMFIALGVVIVFLLISMFRGTSFAG